MKKFIVLMLAFSLVSCSSTNDTFERSTASVPWAEPKQPIAMESHSRTLADICKTPTSGKCDRGYVMDKGNSERCCPIYRLCKTKSGAPGTQRWAEDKYDVCEDAAQETDKF